jgi:hypothetical protein
MLKALIPAALSILAALPAEAACTQANIAGTWTAYAVSQDEMNDLAWSACDLVIGAAGAFTGSNSTCTAAGVTVKVQGSLKLTNAARCAYSGSISLGSGLTDPIPSLTLSLDRQTAAGVGGKNGGGNVFVFNMVKTQ